MKSTPAESHALQENSGTPTAKSAKLTVSLHGHRELKRVLLSVNYLVRAVSTGTMKLMLAKTTVMLHGSQELPLESNSVKDHALLIKSSTLKLDFAKLTVLLHGNKILLKMFKSAKSLAPQDFFGLNWIKTVFLPAHLFGKPLSSTESMLARKFALKVSIGILKLTLARLNAQNHGSSMRTMKLTHAPALVWTDSSGTMLHSPARTLALLLGNQQTITDFKSAKSLVKVLSSGMLLLKDACFSALLHGFKASPTQWTFVTNHAPQDKS